MSRAISTAFTRLLNRSPYLQVPIVGAPMAGAAGAKLACEVTLGGGFGFIPAGYRDVKALRSELESARSILQTPPSASLPLGVAHFGWKMKEQGDATVSELLDVSLQNKVQAIWFSFWENDQIKWVNYIRQSDAKSKESHKTMIFALVNSLEEARVAVNEWKADVIVAQGIEAGGHGGSNAPPIRKLLSSILTGIPEKERPPVLAAGGIVNGSQIAQFLHQGASGAVLGTRFLLTPESTYTPGQKRALLAATSDSTVRSVKFDEARNALGWPQDADGRGLRNNLSNDFEAGVDMNILREKVKEGMKNDNPEYMVTWAGLGVGDIKEIKGAQAIVRDLHDEIQRHM